MGNDGSKPRRHDKSKNAKKRDSSKNMREDDSMREERDDNENSSEAKSNTQQNAKNSSSEAKHTGDDAKAEKKDVNRKQGKQSARVNDKKNVHNVDAKQSSSTKKKTETKNLEKKNSKKGESKTKTKAEAKKDNENNKVRKDMTDTRKEKKVDQKNRNNIEEEGKLNVRKSEEKVGDVKQKEESNSKRNVKNEKQEDRKIEEKQHLNPSIQTLNESKEETSTPIKDSTETEKINSENAADHTVVTNEETKSKEETANRENSGQLTENFNEDKTNKRIADDEEIKISSTDKARHSHVTISEKPSVVLNEEKLSTTKKGEETDNVRTKMSDNEIDVDIEIYGKRNVGNSIYSRIHRLAMRKRVSLAYERNKEIIFSDDDDDNSTSSTPLSQTMNILQKSNDKMERLRLLMNSPLFGKRPLDAYIIKATGAHGILYVMDNDRKLQFMSNISNPIAIGVVADKIAVVWVDVRTYDYVNQKETEERWKIVKCENDVVSECSKWLFHNMANESQIGFDPKFLSLYDYETINNRLIEKEIRTEPISNNLIDIIWDNQRNEEKKVKHLIYLDSNFCPRSIKLNIEKIRNMMSENEADLYIMTDLDNIAATFNLRGFDYPYGSVFLSYATITPSSTELYVDSSKLTDRVKSILNENAVTVKEYDNVLDGLRYDIFNTKNKIMLSVDCSYDIASLVPKKRRLLKRISHELLLELPRSNREIEIIRDAFNEQSMVICELLYWIENSAELTELAILEHMKELASKQPNFIAFNCPPCVAFGAHSVEPFFTPSAENNSVVDDSKLLLLQNQSDYKGGLTSMIRTIHLGQAPQHEKEAYTKVLKSLAQFAFIKFPSGIPEEDLMTIARHHLWGLGIKSRDELSFCKAYWESVNNNVALFTGEFTKTRVWPGTLIANKPSHIRKREGYAIELENILLCKQANSDKTGETQFLSFEDLTLIPFQRKLIDKSRLSDTEIEYINDYHARVLNQIGPLLKSSNKEEVMNWLSLNTEPL